MKFTTSLIAASTAALAAAALSVPTVKGVFSLKSFRSASPIHYAHIVEYQHGLAIGPKQNATCVKPEVDYASFTTSKEGGLYLYAQSPAPQAYVDLSEEGAGRLRFAPGGQSIDPKYKTGPFVIKNDKLFFRNCDKDIEFQACPLHDGEGYSVLLQPNKDLAGPSCISFVASVAEETAGSQCFYKELQE